jgi:hypothetical protein
MNMKWEGINADHYEKLRKSVNWEGNVPKGAVFHVSSFGKNTGYVTDIWESEKEFNYFVENRLMPEVTKLGITAKPQIEIHPVYAVFVPALQSVLA